MRIVQKCVGKIDIIEAAGEICSAQNAEQYPIKRYSEREKTVVVPVPTAGNENQ